MKRSLLFLLILSLGIVHAENPFRQAKVSGEPEKITDVEIVIDRQIPLTKWVSERMQGYLEQALGAKPAIVAEPTDKFAIVLGAGKLATEAGIDVSKLQLEGYVMLRKGNRLFLCGNDSPSQTPTANLWAQRYKRGTISAMYDFLERFADAVFVFPNKFGEVVPRCGALMLPPQIDIQECPDFEVRTHYVGNSAVGMKEKCEDGVITYNRFFLEGRWSEYSIPFTHGLTGLDFIERFSKTHPEYFALMPDGRRHNTPDLMHTGHFCFSNKGFRDEVYADLKAYFTGQEPSSRNMSRKYWASNTFSERRYASVMPQDSYYACCCPECAKIGRGGHFCYNGEPLEERLKTAHGFSNQIWEFTKDMADRLTKDGINASVTQMAYGVTKTPPDFVLPKNLEIQVAVSGLGCKHNWESDLELLKTWNEKTGKKLSIWTYPGKHMQKAAMKGIPAEMHSQMHEYFRVMKPYITGAFIEEETDFFIFNHLNDYVFAHYAWNNDIDANALLDKYYRVMYGPGASVMKTYFDTLEHLWCDKIIGNTVDTGLGPVPLLPSVHQVWRDIYSQKQMSEFEVLFDNAEKAAADDADALARIRYIRENFHGPIKNACEEYQMHASGFSNWRAEYGKKVFLRPCKSAKANVRTWLTVQDETDALLINVECEEPDVANSRAFVPADVLDGECWADSDVEIFINPSGDKKEFFQFAFNSNGALYDSHCTPGKHDRNWNSGAVVKTQKNEASWTAEIRIPKAAFPGGIDTAKEIPVNFARHRVVGKLDELYQWSPSEGDDFHDIMRWGCLTKKASDNILLNPDFTETAKNGMANWSVWLEGGKDGGQSYALDKEIFVTGGQSLRLQNVADLRVSAGQRFKVKAGAKCKLSYYIRLEDVDLSKSRKTTKSGLGAGAYIHAGGLQKAFPQTTLTGDVEWTRQEFTFKVGDKEKDADGNVPCIIGLWNWNCPGTVWYDNVSVTVEGN